MTEDTPTPGVTNNVPAIDPAVTTAADTTTTEDIKPTVNGEKKKRSTFSIFKVAMLMLRGRPSGKPKSVHAEDASIGNWKKVVGSMRPLHLQDNPSPLPSILEVLPSPNVEQFEDVLPPASPSTSITSAGTMSQYASANNLQELDKDEESDGDDEEKIDENGGDEMIDVKAEEFIAQFYKQMRLQHLTMVNRNNRKIAKGKGPE